MCVCFVCVRGVCVVCVRVGRSEIFLITQETAVNLKAGAFDMSSQILTAVKGV